MGELEVSIERSWNRTARTHRPAGRRRDRQRRNCNNDPAASSSLHGWSRERELARAAEQSQHECADGNARASITQSTDSHLGILVARLEWSFHVSSPFRSVYFDRYERVRRAENRSPVTRLRLRRGRIHPAGDRDHERNLRSGSQSS